MTHPKAKPAFYGYLFLTLFLSACGGGGGDDGGGPAPGPTSVTYTVQLTDANLTDERSGTAVTATGLPVAGAQATRQQ